MKLSKHQVQRLVRLVTGQLEESGFLQGKDEHAAAEMIEAVITADLKKEDEIEKEAAALIKKHSVSFHSEELDYELLFKRAKHELAKRKGFKL